MWRPAHIRAAALVALALAIAAAVGGCVPTEISTDTTEQPVTLVLGAPSATLIPYSASLATRQVGGLVYQSLVDIDASGTPRPDLAVEVPTIANGGVSADGRTVEFQLDSEAKWHDGRPVTAQDVAFTFELLKSGALVAADQATLKRVEEVVAVDEQRVRVRLSEPDWPGTLRLIPFVLPQHLLAKSADLPSDAYWEKPVGSGPYRVTKVTRRRAVALQRVADQGVDRITCIFHNTAEEQLETWDSAGRAIWPGATVDPVGSEQLSAVPSNRYRCWVFNVDADRYTATMATRDLVASVLATTAPDAAGPWGVAPAKNAAAADRARDAALRELRRAGWRPDKEGILARDGERLQVVFAYNIESEQDGYALDASIRELRELGVFDKRESTFLYGDYFDAGAILPSGEWDVTRMIALEGAPLGTAWPFDAADIPSETNPGGLNLMHVDDPELERLTRDLRMPHTPEEQAELRKRVGARLAELRLVLPDSRLESRVLVRGLDGVAAAISAEDFTSSWASWTLAQDAAGGRKP